MRLRAQLRRVVRDLQAKLIVLGLPVERVDRNEKREKTRALDVPKELQSESLSLVRSLDDAGNVRHDERPAVAQLNHAEVGRQRGERIVADLRRRGADDGQERGLSGVGLAHESNVRDQLELELESDRFAVLAGLPFTWAAVHGSREPGVALAAPAASRDDEGITALEHLADQLARVVIAYHRARRNGKQDVLARVPRLVGAAAVCPALCLPRVAIGVVEQRGEVAVGTNDHVAPLSSVAAVRPAEWRELLAAERDDARTAVAGRDAYDDPVDEHLGARRR